MKKPFPDKHGHLEFLAGSMSLDADGPAPGTGKGLSLNQKDPRFQSELRSHLKDYVGRPTPLYLQKD